MDIPRLVSSGVIFGVFVVLVVFRISPHCHGHISCLKPTVNRDIESPAITYTKYACNIDRSVVCKISYIYSMHIK